MNTIFDPVYITSATVAASRHTYPSEVWIVGSWRVEHPGHHWSVQRACQAAIGVTRLGAKAVDQVRGDRHLD